MQPREGVSERSSIWMGQSGALVDSKRICAPDLAKLNSRFLCRGRPDCVKHSLFAVMGMADRGTHSILLEIEADLPRPQAAGRSGRLVSEITWRADRAYPHMS